MPESMMLPDGRIVPIPQRAAEAPPDVGELEEEEYEEEAPRPAAIDPREDMSDITGLNDKDKNWLFGTSGVTEVDDQSDDDLSDVLEVDTEDIMGPAPKPKLKSVRLRRTGRRYQPPQSMGGVNY